MEGYIGQIIMFGGNFAPRNWAFCSGQLLAISQFSALFSILGTSYGGDGRTTFGLPDLRGRSPMHAGSGPGLSPRQLGQRGGAEVTTLQASNLPPHAHQVVPPVSNDRQTSNRPAGAYPARGGSYRGGGAPSQDGGDYQTASAGGGQPFDTVHPFQVVNFVICLIGIFPSRS